MSPKALENPDNMIQRPNTFVDTVIFTLINRSLHVLLIQRSSAPFKNSWALIGGYIDVHKDSSIEATAKRKLLEKTGIETPYLEQYGSFGNATRDPRGWSVTNVYFALIPSDKVTLNTGEGAADIKWASLTDNQTTENLAFDHSLILAGCIERLRQKALYTSLPTYLMPDTFTLRELQSVYEIILNQAVEHKSFRRRMLGANVLKEVGKTHLDRGRPATLYTLINREPHFFLRNIEGSR